MLRASANVQKFRGREGLQWEDPGKCFGHGGIKVCLPGITFECVEVNLGWGGTAWYSSTIQANSEPGEGFSLNSQIEATWKMNLRGWRVVYRLFYTLVAVFCCVRGKSAGPLKLGRFKGKLRLSL